MSDDVVRDVLEASKAHPGRRLAWRFLTAGAVFAVFAVATFSFAPGAALIVALMAAIFGGFSRSLFRSIREIGFLNRAYGDIARGERTSARAVLDALAASHPTRAARRHMTTQRAVMSLAEGDPNGAVTHATNAVALRPHWPNRDVERSQVAWAHSLRALAHAVLREPTAALADAEKACDERAATPLAWGNAELARAVLAANDERWSDVRTILDRASPYLDDVGGRERELARNLRKRAAAGARTIYRHAAKPEDDDISTSLTRAAETKTMLAATAPSTAAAPPVKAPPRASAGLRTLALWFALILMFLALWQFMTPSDRSTPPSNDLAPAVTIFAALFFGAYVALIGRAMWKISRVRELRRTSVLRALRGDAEAIRVLEQQAKASPDAALELARLADRAGRFEAARIHCEDGLGLAARAPAMSYDIAAPGLAAERAFCYAALGKVDEADAIMAAIPNGIGYAHVATAQLRVRLAQALMRGDRKEALEIARSRGDCLPLPARDAFLVDLLEAVEGRGADDEEWTHLHAELARDPSLAKYVEHFMPGMGTEKIKRRVVEPVVEPVEPLEEVELSDTAHASEQS